MKSITSLGLVLALAGGCTSHIAPYVPKHRKLDAGEFGSLQGLTAALDGNQTSSSAADTSSSGADVSASASASAGG